MDRNDAIKKSISHWKKNKDAGPVTSIIRGGYCALCVKYVRKEGSCDKCPLQQAGHGCDNEGSLWDVLSVLKSSSQDNEELIAKWEKACDNMIKALTDCLTDPE